MTAKKMGKLGRFFCVFSILISVALADIYMHNPRGSNNRLNEKSANRKNANRLFDSQNNNRGGYNIGDKTDKAAEKSPELQYQMRYYQSGRKVTDGVTELLIEWTNQHGCGTTDPRNPNKLNCDIVVQFMCDERLRDGLTADTPQFTKPISSSSIEERRIKDSKANRGRGQHESWDSYNDCATRDANGGLYLADRRRRGKSAIYTRQNSQGTRRGLECPEERDYFPYWHHTQWKDVAILTSDVSQCAFYKNESGNVKPKGKCFERDPNNPEAFVSSPKENNEYSCAKASPTNVWKSVWNYLELATELTTKSACEGLEDGVDRKWATPFDAESPEEPECLVSLPEMDCLPAPWTRPNHLGNAADIVPTNYTWILPHFPSGEERKCVLRLRYNVSTDDYHPGRTFAPKTCFGGSCYASSKESVDFQTAKRLCEESQPGGHLATIESAEEGERIKKWLAAMRTNQWIGLERTPRNGCRLYDNVEFRSGWLRRIAVEQIEDCQSNCLKDAQCAGFSVLKQKRNVNNQPQHWCYLKRFIRESQPMADIRMSSGICSGSFSWINSPDALTNSSYVDWQRWEPNNFNGQENCAMMIRGWGFKWRDIRCSNKANALCESKDDDPKRLADPALKNDPLISLGIAEVENKTKSCRMIDNATFIGHAIQSLRVADVQECREKCLRETRCVGFVVLKKKRNGLHNCWLKDKNGKKKENPGKISGICDDHDPSVELAVNTAQFGRTFQDRSHVFKLIPRPDNLEGYNVKNLNVRGKRGNIVQTFPAVEYDFVPAETRLGPGDLLHIQWTGSNTHNNGGPAGDGQAGSDGQGKAGTDRHNLVEIPNLEDNFPVAFEAGKMFEGVEVMREKKDGPTATPIDVAVSCATSGFFPSLSSANADSAPSLNPLLNNAAASFSAPLLKFRRAGNYSFMSTRNNAFTNRSQKAKLVVTP